MIFDVGVEPWIEARVVDFPDERVSVKIDRRDGDGRDGDALALRFHDFSDISVLIDELQKVLDEGLEYRKQRREQR